MLHLLKENAAIQQQCTQCCKEDIIRILREE